MNKVSVVIEIESKDNVSRCIESILNQTYKNLEIIVVNTIDEVVERLKNYRQKDKRLLIINSKKNLTTHEKRILGYKKCTGNYIMFTNNNDYVSCDYIRLLLGNIEKNNTDISISKYIDIKTNKIYNYMSNKNISSIKSKDILDRVFTLDISNNRLYYMGLKLIKNKILDSVYKDYEKINITSAIEDDITLSVILYNASKKISFCENSEYFMLLNYSNEDINFESLKRYLENNKLKKYINYVNLWNFKSDLYFNSYSIYNDGLEKIKKKILDKNIRVVSFDMFDTLVVRPFFRPLDMFEFMNKQFIDLTKSNPVVKFSKMRIEAEETLRKINCQNAIEEVTIDEIYEYIKNFYCLEEKIINKMKTTEKELEIKFCKRREIAYELYQLAKDTGKRVIVTSDIYLDKLTVEKILKSNGYLFDKVYISSELLKTKNSGSLYEYLNKSEKSQILHIGDNISSDVETPKKYGIESCYLPRTIDTLMGNTEIDVNYCGRLYEDFDMYNINMNTYLKTTGVRCALAVVANKYFDNPFIKFMDDTKFNSDPYFIGYYALGMHLLSLSNWLLSDTKKKNIDTLSFMARDGYLPLKATSIFQKNTNINSKLILDYVYTSRKATMPLVLSGPEAINALDTYIEYNNVTPFDILKQLESILNLTDKKWVAEVFSKNGIEDKTFSTKEDFYECLKIIYDNFYDKDKYIRYCDMCKKYFGDHFKGKAGTFDIGYSGKPQSLISNVLNKDITTYFYHTTSSEGYTNSYLGEFELNKFYDFMPTLTGTIRELFYSDTVPSCVGYKEDKSNVVPVFGKKEDYTTFNIDMINIIQDSALGFVTDFSTIFGEYTQYLDINKFYMSIPYEYFCQYSTNNDKLFFDDLIFESNVNDTNKFTYYIDIILDDYEYHNKNNFNKHLQENRSRLKEEFRAELIKDGYRMLPKDKLSRIIYYILFDRNVIKEKIGRKK